MLNEFLYADDFVLMSEAIEGLRVKFVKWMEPFEKNGLNADLGKTKVMVSDGIAEDCLIEKLIHVWSAA